MPNMGSAALLAVVVTAAILFVVRKGLAVVARGRAVSADGGTVPFTGPQAGDDEVHGRSLFVALDVCLYVIVALLGAALAGIAVQHAAALMGIGPQVNLLFLPNSIALLCTFVAAFLWVQFGHLLSLRSFWTRGRFVCLLIALPLLSQRLLALGFDATSQLVKSRETADDLAMLFSTGLLPFLVPAFHARLLAPAATWVRRRLGDERRDIIEAAGTLVLIVGIAAVWWAPVSPSHPAAAEAGMFHGPLPNGQPHICAADYPSESMRLGEQGATTMSFMVTPSGTVKDVTIIGSSGYPRLDLAAVVCVTRWTYAPATRNGRPVEAPWKARVLFSLR